MRTILRVGLGMLICFFPVGVEAGDPSGPSLTVAECVEIALERHPSLKGARAQVEAAYQRVWQQVAGYLPRGDYGYNFNRQERPLTAILGGGQVGEVQRRETSQRFNFNSTSFSMDQVLFDFGKNLDSIQSALASKRARDADHETTAQSVILNVKGTYYTVLSAQRLLQVAEENLARDQKHLQEAGARYEVGLAPRFDVTQVQVQVANATLALVRARNNVALARANLRNAMGLTSPLTAELVDDLAYEEINLDADRLLSRAYAVRPELSSLIALQQAAAEQVSSLQKQYLPSLLGRAQYNWTGRDFPLRPGWNVGLAFTFPLFDSVLTRAEVGEAKAELQSLAAQVEELRQAYLNIHEAGESIIVSETALKEARENLEMAEGRYSTGVGNIIELTEAEALLTAAQANHVQALANYKISHAQLEKAVGVDLVQEEEKE
jgi:outer membrane protein